MVSTEDHSPNDVASSKRRRDETEIHLPALDRELKRRNWSDADLARAAGLERTTLFKIRKAGGRCSRTTLDKIALALEENPPRELFEVLQGMGPEPGA